MCGIAGIVALERPAHEIASRVSAMNAIQRHRGPDSAGLVRVQACGATFGHTRLQIIDLTETGAQPMTSEDGLITLSFNGEVYNFQTLRRELELDGYRFRGHSDTEVVLNAFHRWGTDSFPRLNGMFAFAVADARTARVHLVRDRLGIKPLHYAVIADGLAFASEIKAVLASGLVPNRINPTGLPEYLCFGNTLGTRTLYEGIEQLLPGSCLTFDARTKRANLARYWTPGSVAAASPPYEEAVARVRDLLDQSVQRHLIADVPVGVFLSGGIDSSAMVAFASRHYQGRLRTYSVGFDYIVEADELPRARRVAERFGTEHHELRVSGANLSSIVEAVASAHDGPFADPADIPLYQLCRALEGETRVVLQGDGGDELFAGYRRYEYLDTTSLAPVMLRKVGALVLPLLSLAGRRAQGAQRFLRALTSADVVRRTALLLTVEDSECSALRVLAPRLKEELAASNAFQRYSDVIAGVVARDDVDAILRTDLQILLPDIFLQKVDRSTMATSTEVRVPFLDNELVEYVLALPSAYKVRFGEKKRILRSALRGVVPDEVLDGRKVGFGVPVSAWLRGPLLGYLRERLSSAAVRRFELFNQAGVAAAIDEHVANRRDNGQLLWKCLQLALWCERNEAQGSYSASVSAEQCAVASG
jgi:asparagine synthase (glutamine-hydrolysing)